jgi:two-component system sensor histidine kinase BarA
MDSLAVYDRELAIERAGGSPELATDLFGMLLRELPLYRSQLESALAANDLATLQRHVHKLHGSATYTGVSALRHAVASLEVDLKRGVTERLVPQVQEVLQEIDRVLSFGHP